MIRLSRAGWNNVLIFSTLIMIMLLNGLHKNLWSEAELSEAPLLNESVFALTVNFTASDADSSAYRIERAGREWRFMADGEVSTSLDANSVIHFWQQAHFALIDDVVAQHHLQQQGLSQQEPAQIASVWVAGEANPRTFQLYVTTASMPNMYIRGVMDASGEKIFWFEVPKAQVSELGFVHK